MSWARACFAVGGELALDETGWGGAFAGGFALVLVAFAGAFVAVAGLLATVVQLRPRRRRVVAAVLGHLAQLVVQGLNSVGGGGTSRASGGGTTRRSMGGKSRNGVNRPGPSPTSPPSGGSGPGVGLGEVLQCPKGAPPRPAVVWVRLGAVAALLVAPCRGADHNGGADRLRPRRPMGHGLGPGGHGPPPWRAGEPVAFPRAPRSPAAAPASTIWPPGPAPSPCASRRRASEPARPPGGHRSRRAPPADQRSLAALPFLVLGRADGADPPLS